MSIVSILKFALILMVAFFIIKLGSKWLSGKFPNGVTKSVDSVIQSA